MSRPPAGDAPMARAPASETGGPASVGRAIRTPRAAALAGIAFSIVFTLGVVLVRTAVPSDPSDAGQLLTDSSQRDAVLFALGLVPLAGIAFLWFVGVLRDHFGDAEDRFFASVFLGSGLLFVGMLFVTAALAAGLVATAGEHGASLRASGAWSLGRRTANELMNVYAMRMAAVFTLATSTILSRTRLAPRWLVACGFVIAMALLLTISFFPWIALAFPGWVLAVSVYVLITGFTRRPSAEPDAAPQSSDASSSAGRAA